MPSSPDQPLTNVAQRLTDTARKMPGRIAVAAAVPGKAHRPRHERYSAIRYADLDQQATTLARGLLGMGVGPGKRIVLLVKPSIEFVTLVFALLRTGATMVLVDAGLGRKNIVNCLARTEPDGFVGIPLAHVLRTIYRRRFPKAKLNVVVGRRWPWRCPDLEALAARGLASAASLPEIDANDPAAIVFTSGSTGPPKGVEYRHSTFVAQLEAIERMYNLQPGGVDLACFPLFGLFNVALGITTVLPEMDFSRPASCDPDRLIAAANDWQVTQSFASPAAWRRLSDYCTAHNVRMPSLRDVFSCGATVPPRVIERTLAVVHPEARLHTPYGATECLPVSTIDGATVLGETGDAYGAGQGVCVGHKVDSIAWRIVAISDDAIACDHLAPLAQGEIGELIVSGPQVTQRYVATTDDAKFNSMSKVVDGGIVWHRTGDVGYFDDQGRFWYCGRKSQRVNVGDTPLFTECVEGKANMMLGVQKSALVSVRGKAVMVIESERSDIDSWSLLQLAKSLEVSEVLLHPRLPVDIRHNSKIRREELAAWAARKLAK